MKQFIDLGSDITNNGLHAFSFFCTEKGTIETFNGKQHWTSLKAFASDYDNEEIDIQFYLGLIPFKFNVDDSFLTVELNETEIELEKLRPNTYLEPIAITDLEADLKRAVDDKNYKLAHYISAKLEYLTKGSHSEV
ncbi:hypothetical protein BN863_28740 [Formosa agariphila KMM 3901]|uniref:Uncharacterized protein n=1 Tax=Formosa agariphila (strain DSM 15362 / KCTC 12365 / LMG 23005 / KMM 3901 / M-2Alg 35-1) TaxID=1347342 RepID=T2KQ54_FORAG|nr:hypothetical protein [Formosa agariphila]CDF80586.1 hypothetical protein BN863_28740 [Formosa agariphila KMM 3901]